METRFELDPNLTRLFDSLYQAMASYTRPAGTMQGAFGPFAIPSVPVRDIHEDWCDIYLPHAITTIGESSHFRHLVPRLAELMTLRSLRKCSTQKPEPVSLMIENSHCDWKDLADKLLYDGFDAWPVNQRSAIGSLARFVFRRASVSEAWRVTDLYGAVCAWDYFVPLVLLDDAPAMSLEAWEQCKDSHSALNFMAMLLMELADLRKDRPTDTLFVSMKSPHWRVLADASVSDWLRRLSSARAEQTAWLQDRMEAAISFQEMCKSRA